MHAVSPSMKNSVFVLATDGKPSKYCLKSWLYRLQYIRRKATKKVLRTLCKPIYTLLYVTTILLVPHYSGKQKKKPKTFYLLILYSLDSSHTRECLTEASGLKLTCEYEINA